MVAKHVSLTLQLELLIHLTRNSSLYCKYIWNCGLGIFSFSFWQQLKFQSWLVTRSQCKKILNHYTKNTAKLQAAVNQSSLMIQYSWSCWFIYCIIFQCWINSREAKFFSFWQYLKFHGPVLTGWKCQNCLCHHTETVWSICKSKLSGDRVWAVDSFGAKFFPVGWIPTI